MALGIGQYTAYGLAAHGIKRLAVADINPKALQTTVNELKKRYPDVDVKAIEMDVSSEKSVEDGIRETVGTFGRIDIAINNAGIGGPTIPTPEVAAKDWSKVLNVNLTGVWMCQRAQIQQMLKQE
jgi:NAD(P)-dependent dehydrogenase (short-subunit alcohol dehydrogenase family)